MSSPGEVRRALQDVVSRADVDSVVMCFMPPSDGNSQQLAEVAAQVAQDSPKTHVACFLGIREATHRGPKGSTIVPAYPAPEDAVRALADATGYAMWRRRDHGTLVNPEGIDDAAGRRIVEESLDMIAGPDGEPARMPEHLVMALLQSYGIEVAPAVRVSNSADAEVAAERIGYPVILKYASRPARDRLTHYGYRLDIGTSQELHREYQELVDQASEDDLEAGMLVQQMAPYGQSVTISSIEDPLFGPVLSFGLHGDPADLLGDVAHRIPPLTTVDVAEMVRAVKASPRLFGYRGSPRLDIAALEDLIARVSRLADDLPEINRFSLKPVVVAESGVVPLNARIWLSRPKPRTDAGPRRMRTGG
jgi:acyl-CoA synthetase (NDP forming)